MQEPSPAAPSAHTPWFEHGAAESPLHWTEQFPVAHPASHVQFIIPLPSAEQSVAMPWPEQHAVEQSAVAKPSSQAHEPSACAAPCPLHVSALV